MDYIERDSSSYWISAHGSLHPYYLWFTLPENVTLFYGTRCGFDMVVTKHEEFLKDLFLRRGIAGLYDITDDTAFRDMTNSIGEFMPGTKFPNFIISFISQSGNIEDWANILKIIPYKSRTTSIKKNYRLDPLIKKNYYDIFEEWPPSRSDVIFLSDLITFLKGFSRSNHYYIYLNGCFTKPSSITTRLRGYGLKDKQWAEFEIEYDKLYGEALANKYSKMRCPTYSTRSTKPSPTIAWHQRTYKDTMSKEPYFDELCDKTGLCQLPSETLKQYLSSTEKYYAVTTDNEACYSNCEIIPLGKWDHFKTNHPTVCSYLRLKEPPLRGLTCETVPGGPRKSCKFVTKQEWDLIRTTSKRQTLKKKFREYDKEKKKSQPKKRKLIRKVSRPSNNSHRYSKTFTPIMSDFS
tara:strand:+ start:1746 stop:2966 length:1221 start_codon:yes stop_codon:yes gene_type:complete